MWGRRWTPQPIYHAPSMNDSTYRPRGSCLAPVRRPDNATAKPAKRARADYDQALANAMTEAAALLQSALGDRAILDALSYSGAEI